MSASLDPTKIALLRARAIAYDEGFKCFLSGDVREKDNPYVGNLKGPWAQGWADAKAAYDEAKGETLET